MKKQGFETITIKQIKPCILYVPELILATSKSIDEYLVLPCGKLQTVPLIFDFRQIYIQHKEVKVYRTVISLLSVLGRSAVHCQLSFCKCSVPGSVLMECRTNSMVFSPCVPKESEKPCGKMKCEKVDYKKMNFVLSMLRSSVERMWKDIAYNLYGNT